MKLWIWIVIIVVIIIVLIVAIRAIKKKSTKMLESSAFPNPNESSIRSQSAQKNDDGAQNEDAKDASVSQTSPVS